MLMLKKPAGSQSLKHGAFITGYLEEIFEINVIHTSKYLLTYFSHYIICY